MPVHDWTRVGAAIFDDFHHEWISTIRRALNDGLLPSDYYALVEQETAAFGAEVLTLQESRLPATVAVRHVSADHIVAVVEVISPGNKSARNPLKAWINKASELLEHKIHLLILDLFPPTKRDLQGIHGVLWEGIGEESFSLPPDKRLTLAAYVASLTIEAYVESVTVGDLLPDMPLFLEPGAYVQVPLESTYQSAYAAVPRRWKKVLEDLAKGE